MFDFRVYMMIGRGVAVPGVRVITSRVSSLSNWHS